MLRGEKLGELRAENGKRGHAEEGREVARSGVVANEAVGGGEFVQQTIEIAEGVVEQDDVPAVGAHLIGDELETVERPTAHRAGGTGVDHDAATRARGRGGRGEGETEVGGKRGPVVGAMRAGRSRKGTGQKKARARAGKSDAARRPGEREQEMIAGIGAGGDGEIEAEFAEGAAELGERGPRPAVQAVFAGEGGPRGGEREQINGRGEAVEQRRGVGRGDERDAVVGGGGAQKRKREREVAEAPEFKDEEARQGGGRGRGGGGWRRFCQASGVSFSIGAMTSYAHALRRFARAVRAGPGAEGEMAVGGFQLRKAGEGAGRGDESCAFGGGAEVWCPGAETMMGPLPEFWLMMKTNMQWPGSSGLCLLRICLRSKENAGNN